MQIVKKEEIGYMLSTGSEKKEMAISSIYCC